MNLFMILSYQFCDHFLENGGSLHLVSSSNDILNNAFLIALHGTRLDEKILYVLLILHFLIFFVAISSFNLVVVSMAVTLRRLR